MRQTSRCPLLVLAGFGLLVGCPKSSLPGDDDEASSGTQGETQGDSGETTTTTDGESGTTATDTSNDAESDTATFVPNTDTGEIIDCWPIVQDCPEGEKCVWYAPQEFGLRREAARCIPVTGDLPPFAPCSLPTGIGPEVSDDCGPESFCLEVYGTADHGFCAPFAKDEQFGDFCKHLPGTEYATENGSSFPDACLYYDCNPLLAETCPADTRCVFYPAFLYGTTMCWQVPAEADLPVGAACDFGDCGPGKLCAPTEWLPDCGEERCCTQWCDLNNPSCATAGTECTFFPAWTEWDNPDYQNLGACVLPGALG